MSTVFLIAAALLVLLIFKFMIDIHAQLLFLQKESDLMKMPNHFERVYLFIKGLY